MRPVLPVSDTPLYDSVLSDALARARREVEAARAEAEAARSALHGSVADAIEQKARQRAEALVADRADRVAGLEQRVQRSEAVLTSAAGLHADDGTGTCRGCGLTAPCPTAALLEGEVGLPVAVRQVAERLAEQDERRGAEADQLDALEERTAQRLADEPAGSPAGGGGPQHWLAGLDLPRSPTAAPAPSGPAASPAAAVSAAPSAPARARDETGEQDDGGPEGTPAVPSMKEIFATTKASGWLDSLLGPKK